MSALFFVVALTQDSISADSRLRSPINLDESLVPLSRFVDEASAATGLTFTASKAVRNLKVDAFVDNMPVGKTLEKVAQALDLKWTRTGTGYELDEDPSKAALAQAYMQAENELAGKKLLHNIAVYVDIAKLVPADSKPDILTTNQGTYRSMLDQTQRDLTNAISNRQEESEIEKLSVR